MHQLEREGLQFETNVDQFFAKYLGEQVLERLDQSHVRFSNWPDVTRQALRSLCIHFARTIPEADHVIRADVDTRGHVPSGVEGDLLLYFGHQMGPIRSQYTGVALKCDSGILKFALYIAGTNDENRASKIAAEDPRRVLEGREIAERADVDRLNVEAISVLQIQRIALQQQKGIGTTGFCPTFCQHRWNRGSRRPDEEAWAEVSAYWRRRKSEISSEQIERERSLMQENNRYRYGRAVEFVRDHVSVEDAYSLALSEQA